MYKKIVGAVEWAFDTEIVILKTITKGTQCSSLVCQILVILEHKRLYS